MLTENNIYKSNCCPELAHMCINHIKLFASVIEGDKAGLEKVRLNTTQPWAQFA